MAEPEISLIEALVKHIGTRWRLDHFTYVDEVLGFIYFAAPAVANIRTIGSLTLGKAQALGTPFELNSLRPIHDRAEGLIASPEHVGDDIFARMLEDDTVIKLAFVRDPVARFAAIYRNMFSLNTKNSQQRVKLFEHLGMPLEENLSMLDLAELLLEEEEVQRILPPLMHQRRLIAYDLVDYEFIGRHERWEQDYPTIAAEIFGCAPPLFDPVQNLNMDPEGTRLAIEVDSETRAAIEAAYAPDMEMLAEMESLFPDGFSAM